MSMNKKELAEMAALRRELTVMRALNWTAAALPDLPIPAALDQTFTEGWDFNAYSKSVRSAWSTSVSNGDGPYPVDRRYSSGSQGGKELFSTKLLALRAMRHIVERQAAEKLADIDEQIADAASPIGHQKGGDV